MSTPSPFAEAAEGFAELAEWWVGQATEAAADLADKLASGSFTVDDAAAAFGRGLTLSWLGWAGLLSESLDAAAVIAKPPGTVHIARSQTFHTAPADVTRTLLLAGPLVNGFGDTLPTTAVELVPSTLTAGETGFEIRATVRSHPAGTYKGVVDVHHPDGEIEQVHVFLVVG